MQKSRTPFDAEAARLRSPTSITDVLGNAFEELDEPISITDAQDRIVLVNRRFRELNPGIPAHSVGSTYEEHLRAGLALGYYPESGQDTEAWIAARLSHRRANAPPLEVARQDGRWLLVADQWLPGGGIVTFSLDISDRRRAEAALREREQHARRLAYELDALFRQAMFGIALVREQRVERSNPRFAAFFGLSIEEITGLPTRKLFPSDEIFEEFRAHSIAKLMRDGFVELDRELMRRDGSFAWARIRASLLELGNPGAGAVWMAIDITERKRAEDALQALTVTLEQRVAQRTADLISTLKELEEFTYSISHDLRTPLRAMGGFARMVLDDDAERLSDEARRKLGVVEINARKMGQLVDGLLTLARVSRADVSQEPVDMRELANSVALELKTLYPNCSTQVEEIPLGNGDSNLLRQALFNLLENALKFSSKSVSPKVSVAWDASKRAYVVSDNGVGFDMRFVGKLFRNFERLHTEAEYPGTGIGLVIVKRVLDRHSGRVWAESAPGSGARFYFSLDSMPPTGSSAPNSA